MIDNRRDSHQGRPHHHFITHPERGGRIPSSFLHGRSAIREELRDMARRLGTQATMCCCQYVLPVRRHGAGAAAADPEAPSAAHVPIDGSINIPW